MTSAAIGRRARPPIGRIVWVVLGGLFFFGPLVAAFVSSINYNKLGYRFTAYNAILRSPDIGAPLWLSFQIAIYTVIVSLLLMLPTVFWMQLKVPTARPLVEIVSILPYVIPPIILVVGIAQLTRGWPEWMVGRPFFLVPIYVVICLPFLFRALDAGMRAIDLVTLTEASRGLGATWPQVMTKVVFPNLRTAVLGSVFLCLAVVMGEFTIASLLLFNTFPIYLSGAGRVEAQGAAALSLLAFAVSWIFLLILNAVSKRVGRSSAVDITGATGR
jgi:putative spermidine/putrescine transport system permease protein